MVENEFHEIYETYAHDLYGFILKCAVMNSLQRISCRIL